MRKSKKSKIFRRGRSRFIRRAVSSSKKNQKIISRETVLILDFGSQYTQLIARRIRENRVYSQIVPYNTPAKEIANMSVRGIIFSGGPASIYDKDSPVPDKDIFKLGKPILGICYGMQLITHFFGGKVSRAIEKEEYGKTELFIDDHSDLFNRLPGNITCWMSHADYLSKLPRGFITIAHTLNSPIAAISYKQKKIYGVQFHPEVIHTLRGNQILANFLFRICGCFPNWMIESFIKEAVGNIKKIVGKSRVVCGLSGGVDSSVTAILVDKAIGRNQRCIFIDNGLLRKDEPRQIKKTFRELGLNLDYVDAGRRFLTRLKGITDPEAKRKIIGEEFVRIFEAEANKVKRAEFLAQGTLYPDVIESAVFKGHPQAKIKTHHNVGGLPEHMRLKLIEPLRDLFKDEVRFIAKELGLPDNIIHRQPFPGPGLAVRIIGEVTPERLKILREVDRRVVEEIRSAGFYQETWQSFAILLPIRSVGVMGDNRTYESVVAVRCVTSSDGMTADWAKLPHEILEKISRRIINEVKGVNRVVYDISSKPPATIEWE